MTKAARFDTDARAELNEAIVWYDRERVGLGDDFLAEVVRVALEVGEAPEAHPEASDVHGLPPGSPAVRQARVKRFPYRLVYVELPDMVLVVAVAHIRRRPGYWHGRLR